MNHRRVTTAFRGALRVLVLATLAIPSVATRARAQSTPLTALRFRALADPSGRSTPDAVIIIQADTILRVGTGSRAIPAGARVIDLRRFTAIPGLIDVHTHMTYWRDRTKPASAARDQRTPS